MNNQANDRNNFPFHYIKFPIKNAKKNTYYMEIPFIEQVKKALDENLQKVDTFGCKIENCHTHAGSKIHFENFIEAELLFHNNYYNEHFAQLTFSFIKEFILCSANKEGKTYSNILLIGYENYSELYLQEVQKIILTEKKYKCNYCVYETIAIKNETGSIMPDIILKNLKKSINEKMKNFVLMKGNNEEKFAADDTLCVFIVPINTTLSTLDKMIARFILDTNIDLSVFHRKYICLITLGPKLLDDEQKKDSSRCKCDLDENEKEKLYWTIDEDNNNLIPIGDKFEYLNEEDPIKNIVIYRTIWQVANKCEKCFPDQIGHELESEEPVFGVNRGSVVPMLKIGNIKYLQPISIMGKNSTTSSTSEIRLENLKKVWELSEFMFYGHIVRGENHFQYYIETDKFLQKNLENKMNEYFDRIIKKLDRDTEKDNSLLIFDYIVAPRHQTNAPWIYMVNEKVFNGNARIMYFDVDREFRSNIKAKYSDLTNSLENIQSSNQNFYIRFHFVDDTINSGSTFLRAKNLIMSISSCIREKNRISLFNSIILLINRLSDDTKKFYIGNERFFKYIDINISPMRRHDDACTLCKIIYDYSRIKYECATDKMSDMCFDVINRHREISITKMQMSNVKSYSKVEKRYLFFISHLLSERISNIFYLRLSKVNDLMIPIDSESGSDEIKEIFIKYYDDKNALAIIENYCEKKYKQEKISKSMGITDVFLWKIAFIKAISRPFHTYHIRQRQAAFSFCLEKLNELLSKDFKRETPNNRINDSIMIQTLVKALSDMKANYLIREKILDRLIERAIDGRKLYSKYIANDNEEIDCKKYILRRLFTEDSLLHYIKKSITLSRDKTKSLLLEHILLTNSEKSFFKSEINNKKINVSRYMESEEKLSVYGYLYLENNTILKEIFNQPNILKKFYGENENKKNGDKLYFFSNFKEIWKINLGEENYNYTQYRPIFEKYIELKNKINDFPQSNKKDRIDLSTVINVFFDKLLNSESELQSLVFVRDKNEKNILFKYFTIAGKPEDDKTSFNCKIGGLSVTQSFYFDDNLKTIDSKLEDNSAEFILIDDKLRKNVGKGKALIIKFSTNKDSDYEVDESIYIQIWGFDKDNHKHWFALKLIMTLRTDFIELIEKINLQELIEERKVDMQKNALSINKSTTHAEAEKYFKGRIYDEVKNEKINEIICKNSPTRFQYGEVVQLSDYQFILYDTYYQLIADEFISSLYRKIIKSEEDLFEDINHKIRFDDLFQIIKERFFNDTEEDFNSPKLGYFRSSIYAANKGEKIDLLFINNMNDEIKQKAINNWKQLASINPILNVINLMAMNAMKYQNTDGKKEISIYFDEKGITFKNTIDPNQVNVINEYIETFTKIPPWLFKKRRTDSKLKKGNHITLWSLIQAEKIDSYLRDNKYENSNKSNSGLTDSIKVTVKAEECSDNTAMFIVNLKLF